MDKKQIEIGKEYALREPVKAGVEFQHVKVLDHVRGSNWRVEWIDPNPGLVDFVAFQEHRRALERTDRISARRTER